MSRNFMELLHAKFGEGKFVCVGLDSDITKMPKFGDQFDSSRGIIFASSGEDFAEAARVETIKLDVAIRKTIDIARKEAASG